MCPLSSTTSKPVSIPSVIAEPDAGSSSPQMESSLQGLAKGASVSPTPVHHREVQQGLAEGPGVLSELRQTAVEAALEPELSPEEELFRKRERKKLEEEWLSRAAKGTAASTTADAERHEAREVQAERTAARVKHAELRVLQAQRQIEAARLGVSSNANKGVLARISVDTPNAVVNLDSEGPAK